MSLRLQLPIFLILLFLGWSTSTKAQDPRFSQFYAAPMHLNPAMTGAFDGSWRVALNYRDQWASILQQQPFRTIGAGFDMRLNVAGNDYFSFGLNFMGDQAGESRLRQTNGHLSMSYLKELTGGRGGNAQYLIAGGQAGFGQSRLDYSGLWFTDQFDVPSENLDLSQQSAEMLNNSNNPYMDINAGLLWYAIFDDNFSLYAGGAMNHINRPEVSLIDGSEAFIPLRWTIHIGGELPLTREFSLLPAIAVMDQGGSNSFTFGLNFRYTNYDWRELAVRIGTWMHLANKDSGILSDALTFAAILELDRMNLGLSYDINISPLIAATNSRGTVELSFIYVHPEERRVRVKCPNF